MRISCLAFWSVMIVTSGWERWNAWSASGETEPANGITLVERSSPWVSFSIVWRAAITSSRAPQTITLRETESRVTSRPENKLVNT